MGYVMGWAQTAALHEAMTYWPVEVAVSSTVPEGVRISHVSEPEPLVF